MTRPLTETVSYRSVTTALLLTLAAALPVMPHTSFAGETRTAATQSALSKTASPDDERGKRESARARQAAMAGVKSWAIQLRYIEKQALQSSPFDLIVIDHAPHPKKDVEIPFAFEDVASLKRKPGGSRRIVLAYLSIGEAERYRFYWKAAWDAEATRPKWLGKENPQWPGDYLVDFSNPDWQSIIFGRETSYLDKLLAAGFDGVFLDRADAFQDTDGAVTSGGEDAMQGFLSRLADYAHRKNPDFLVVMQNAEELAKSKSLLARLDGIAKEDLFFGAGNDEAENPKQMVKDSLSYLRRAKRAGLKVLLLEYARAPQKIAQIRDDARREGFVLHLTDRLLGVLSVDGIPSPAAGDVQSLPVP